MKKHLGATFWILVVGGLHTWWLTKVGHLHGDLLYFESIFRDGRLPPHALSSFQYTEAIFAFPDLILFYLIRAVVYSPAWVIVTYHGVFTLAQAGLLYALWSRIWPKRTHWVFASALAVFYFLTDTTWIYLSLPSSPEHHGALGLLELAMVWQIVDLLDHHETHLARWLGFNFVVMLGLGFSDLLVIPTLLAPLMLFLGVLADDNRLGARAFAQLLLVNVIGLIGGIWIKYTLVHNGWLNIDPADMVTLDWRRFILSCQRFTASLLEFGRHDWFFWSWVGLIFIGGRRALRSRTRWHNVFLAAAVTIGASKLTAILSNGRWDGVSALRYFQELYFLPLVEICLFVLPPLLTRARARVLAPCLIALALVALAWPPPHLGLTDKPELTRCLEQHRNELTTPWGLGDFWVAKLITFTSTERLVVNQVKRNFSRYLWMNSPIWYEYDVHGRHIDKYSYAIAFTPDSEMGAYQRYGWPATKFICPFEDRLILVLTYPKGIAPDPADNSRVR